MSTLTEGLKQGDLEHMVLPMLSIDEFSSKIDDKTVIVVAFYSFEEDPAHDLSNFIERSPTQVLDTDVSPAPSKEGYYLTFVEFKRNNQFPQRLIAILNEVNKLTRIDDWQFTSFKLPKGKIVPVNNENLAKWVDLKPKADAADQKLKEFLQHSCLDNFVLEQSQLILRRGINSFDYEFGGIQNHVPQAALLLKESAAAEANRLQRLLDGPYQVHPFEFGLVVEHTQSQDFLILHHKKI